MDFVPKKFVSGRITMTQFVICNSKLSYSVSLTLLNLRFSVSLSQRTFSHLLPQLKETLLEFSILEHEEHEDCEQDDDDGSGYTDFYAYL